MALQGIKVKNSLGTITFSNFPDEWVYLPANYVLLFLSCFHIPLAIVPDWDWRKTKCVHTSATLPVPHPTQNDMCGYYID